MPNLKAFLELDSKGCVINHLPLMHTAHGEDFLSIEKSGFIKPQECKVFAPEKLSYFFLGRPAYKSSVVFNPSFWQLPAIFVFNQLPLLKAKRIFPFDSGALKNGRYAEIIGRINSDDLSVDESWEAVSKLIQFFSLTLISIFKV